MKNHWIKRRQDKEDREWFRKKLMEPVKYPSHKWQSCLADQAIKEMMIEEDRKFMEIVSKVLEEK